MEICVGRERDDRHTARFGELDSAAKQVEESLPQTSAVADQFPRRRLVAGIAKFQSFDADTGCEAFGPKLVIPVNLPILARR